jgi:hypothetical protein
MTKKDDKFKRPGSGVAPPPLDKVEHELVLADMRYLIQKEKENGDWAKWEESQKPWKSMNNRFESVEVSIAITVLDIYGNPVVIAGPAPISDALFENPPIPDAIMQEIRRTYINRDPPASFDEFQRRVNNDPNADPLAAYLRPGSITAEIFTFYVGRAPENDDLVRANCEHAGQLGHYGCGWCNMCMKPRFMCGHGIGMTSSSNNGGVT